MHLLVTCLLSVVFVAPSNVQSQPQQSRPAARDPNCDAVVQRVLLLLPRQPVQVKVFDMDDTTDLLRSKFAHVDGFVTDSSPAVYLRKQSPTFQHALAGPGIWDYALAITVWHEMAHLDGDDERHAQEKEEELWRQFIVAGRVDTRRGMAYLGLLRKRHQP
jgi:hypothetical protein